MIIGIGIDICNIRRFERITCKASPLFFKRLLTEAEHEYYQEIESEKTQARWLAGVFAAKEAILKATSIGIDGRYGLNTISSFSSIEHSWKACLPSTLLERFGKEVQCHLAVSFSKKQAIAYAILEK